jgi:hypothetical protein
MTKKEKDAVDADNEHKRIVDEGAALLVKEFGGKMIRTK